jgi:antitoxin VapB
MASLNIKDEEAHRLAAELARRTGESLTTAVKQALRERLAREQARGAAGERKLRRVMALAAEIAVAPELDPRSLEEILGYDEDGLPG